MLVGRWDVVEWMVPLLDAWTERWSNLQALGLRGTNAWEKTNGGMILWSRKGAD